MGKFKKFREDLGHVMLATIAEVKKRAEDLSRLSLGELRDLAALELEAHDLLKVAKELKAKPEVFLAKRIKEAKGQASKTKQRAAAG
ncbi:MAG: hypothetical protein PVG03_13850 [Desulfarculaceae bacterium]|jgi:hypothetical protein